MKNQIFTREVKPTIGQTKKHYTQFTGDELTILLLKIDKVRDRAKLSFHLVDKKNEVNISDIHKVLSSKKYDIIEYNQVVKEHHTDHRVLIRGREIQSVSFNDTVNNKQYNCLCNLCFVMSLDSGLVVTSYFNKSYDCHYTIDWARYDAGLQIIN